jgi:hypothetical protein
MSATARRKITLTYSGDVDGEQELNAADNASSPASVEIKTLASGLNTITVPTGGTVPTAVTILPPGDNETSITLKGVTGDTGVRIHNTDPTTIALHSGVATFVLTTGAVITGVRLYWT